MAPAKTFLLNGLVEKMTSQDSDFRFMALNDLAREIAQDPAIFGTDEAVEAKVMGQVLKLVEDKNSEVKNQAVKCLGQLIKIVHEPQMAAVVDKLIEYSGGSDEELRDIAGLALKTVTAELPQESTLAAKACAQLSPKLLAQLAKSDTPPETALENLAILSILVTRFPLFLADADPPPLPTLIPLLNHSRPAVRKRVIITIAQFLPISSNAMFDNLVKSTIAHGLAPIATLENQRTTVQLLGAISRYSPQKIAPISRDVITGVLKAANRDDSELRENALQTLETLVLRCPTEVTPFLPQITGVGIDLIKYDPNYAGGDDGDEDMGEADGDEDDEELEDVYSDDEDTSYKVRRSATKLFAAIIGTRPELLITIFHSVSPVLISRFGDREESVRLEVWATYSLLLKQTAVYGGQPTGKDAENSIGAKRKREQEGMDVEDTPQSLLRSQVPALSKSLLKQLQGKVPPPTLQAGISLLHSLLDVLPGSLSGQVPQLTFVMSSVLSTPSNTSTAGLQTTALSFLALFFATHTPAAFASSIPTLSPKLTTSIAEKHPRIASEAFRVFSALLTVLKPVPSADWADAVYLEAVKRLERHDTDIEVRQAAEEVIADLWLCATDVVRTKGGKEWDALLKSGRSEGAVKVVEKVARNVEMSDVWVRGCIEWVLTSLKKPGKTGKAEAFGCLEVLLRSFPSGVPADLPPAIKPQLAPYITINDIPLLVCTLNVLTALLQLSPSITFPVIESDCLPAAYDLGANRLIAGPSLEALLSFFAALVKADLQIEMHVVPGLTIALEKANATGGGSPGNVSKCIGVVVKAQPSGAAGVIAQFAKLLKKAGKGKEPQAVLSLLTLGEIGRFIDMSDQREIFDLSIAFFGSDSEDVRAAAAFSAGNIAIGNVHNFVPTLVKQISSPEKRVLSLQALKEVVTYCEQSQLERVADLIWAPLFETSQVSEESTRNIAAACLGKLTTTNPSRYLPQLQARLRDESPEIRATVVSAIRYTFADTAQSYDELLAPLIVEFLSLMQDADLTVRRLSLSALNAAARHKPHIIQDHLAALLPKLYNETKIVPELIKIIDMGPWKHRVDGGLENRKTAYETMYTILDTCLTKIDLHEFLSVVLRGLTDDADEIKVLCHMMLFRLSQVAPTTVSQRLDEASPELEETMKGPKVTKDTVKQDLERAMELQRSALRSIAALSKIANVGVSPRFCAFVESVEKGPFAAEYRDML